MLLGCKNNSTSTSIISDNDNSTADLELEKVKKTDMPEILFENISHHFGEVIQGEQLYYTFHFKNVGISDLIILDLDASCGCTRPIPTKEPIKSGEQGKIAISVDTEDKKIGEMISYVVVTANTEPSQTILTLYANVLSP